MESGQPKKIENRNIVLVKTSNTITPETTGTSATIVHICKQNLIATPEAAIK